MAAHFKHRIISFFNSYHKEQENKKQGTIDYKERLDKILRHLNKESKDILASIAFIGNFKNKHLQTIEVPGENPGDVPTKVHYYFRRYKILKGSPQEIEYHCYTYSQKEGIKEFVIDHERTALYEKVYSMFSKQKVIQPILEELKFVNPKQKDLIDYKTLVINLITEYHNRASDESFRQYSKSLRGRLIHSARIKKQLEGSAVIEINYLFNAFQRDPISPYQWLFQCYQHTKEDGMVGISIEEAHEPLYRELYEMMQDASSIDRFILKESSSIETSTL